MHLGTIAGFFVALFFSAIPLAAADPTPGLFDRPVLAIDPGRHTATIRRADVDAAGQTAVTGSHDKTVRLWSVADGKLLRTIRMPTGTGQRRQDLCGGDQPRRRDRRRRRMDTLASGRSARADLPVRRRHRRHDRPAHGLAGASSIISPFRRTAGGWRRCSAGEWPAALPPRRRRRLDRRGARRGLWRRQLRRRLRP